jgi:hypothetical protein
MNRFPVDGIGRVDDMRVPILQIMTQNENPIINHLIVGDGAVGVGEVNAISIVRYVVVCDGVATGDEEIDATPVI